MRIWTVHARQAGRPSRLVQEGFAWGALLFGPLWFAVHGALAPAVLLLATEIALATLLPPDFAATAIIVLAVLAAASARDVVRGWLALHGFRLVDVVAAPDHASARLRLADRRPDPAANAA